MIDPGDSFYFTTAALGKRAQDRSRDCTDIDTHTYVGMFLQRKRSLVKSKIQPTKKKINQISQLDARQIRLNIEK